MIFDKAYFSEKKIPMILMFNSNIISFSNYIYRI